MTDNIKLPPLPEPDHFAFHDFGQGIWVEGGPTGTPFYSEQQVQELMREAVRLNAQAVPDGMVLVDRGALNMAINALRRDAEEGKQVRGEMADLLSAAPAAPQPAQQPLTDEQIADALFFGEYTAQSTKATFTAVARAIEQAATAPLLAMIAEIEAELEKTKAIFAASCNHAAVMEMDRDAKRWRAMRQTMMAVDFEPEMGGSPVVMFELHAKTVRAGPEGADEIADAAMKEQGHA